jgi:plastocyanin
MSNWRAALLIGVPLVVAACTGSTYGQQAGPTSTPGMTMTASAPPVVSTPPAVSSAPPTAVAPGSTAAPGASAGATLHIAALDLAFDTNQLQAPAGQPFVIEFANNDPSIPHNIDILDAAGKSIFKGDIVTGPSTVSYHLPALPAGSYAFHCDVHPFMTGTLMVE